MGTGLSGLARGQIRMTAAENDITPDGQEDGKVIVLYDSAKAISPDEMERTLAVGSPVYAYDLIVTEGDAKISILIDDADYSQIELENNGEILIDEDIFDGVNPEVIAETTAGIEEVRQTSFFIENTSLFMESGKPASSDETSVISDHTAADFDRATHEGNVSSNAYRNVSEFLDHNDYTDHDNSTVDNDPLDHLLHPGDGES